MLAHGEMLARKENRVVLDPTRRDTFGVPAAHITCTPSPNEEAIAADAAEEMRAMAAAAGLEVRMAAGSVFARLALKLWEKRLFAPSGAFLPGSAAHESGGAAMGSDARTSVTDRFGALWDAPNVVVADGAAFPSGCCQNVTLTLMALAARAAEHLAKRLTSAR
jgi:choline dehydrogenase-like flavoprotein